MEHRLIRGGEKFLPFARTRIAALKALGTPYASQSFEIRSAKISVRIEPGHEHIRIEEAGSVYMETGQLGWTYPGGENPTKAEPAAWHFLDIPTDGPFLGRAKTGKKGFGEQPNGQRLTEGMDSRAVGYPKSAYPDGATPEEMAEIDANNMELKDAYEQSTILKKITAGLYPASLYSGKLRAFIQAQYGAAETVSGGGLSVDLTFGTSGSLIYYGSDGSEVQFGLWSHNSPGLFTAPDGSYWLLTIRNPVGTEYVVTAYRIKHSQQVGGFLKKLKDKDEPPSQEDHAKLEAYVFAYSTIDTTNPVEVGTFSGVRGSALAYGWKWKSDGSEAKIVVHELRGTDNYDNRWASSTMAVAFGYTPPTDTEPAKITMTASVESGDEWTDGWGYWNIFVPALDPPFGGPIELKSLATNRPAVKEAFSFPTTPVYGYYVDDEWIPVTMTRNVDLGPFPKRYHEYTGPIHWNSEVLPDQLDVDARGVIPSSASVTYEDHSLSKDMTMTVTVGGTSYDGREAYGDHYFFERSVVGGSNVASPFNNIAASVGDFSSYGTQPLPDGYPDWFYYSASSVTGTVSMVSTESWRFTGGIRDVWVLVIPPGDCEAVYVATNGYIGDVVSGVHRTTVASMVTSMQGITNLGGTPAVYQSFSFIPWAQANSTNSTGFGAPSPTDLVAVEDTEPRVYDYTYINCYNALVQGDLGTPSGSYYTLFNADINVPYYNGTMYTYTSAGNRYVMSEGLMSPASVNYLHRFVGWA